MGLSAGIMMLATIAAPVSMGSGDRWQLYTGLFGATEIELCLPAGDPSPAVAEAVAKLEGRGEFKLQLTRAGEAPPAGRAKLPRIVLGEHSTPGMQPILEALEIEAIEPAGFLFGGTNYIQERDVLVACLEDPERPGLPLTVYLGVEAETAQAFLGDLELTSNPGFVAYRGGHPMVQGELERSGVIIKETVQAQWGRWQMREREVQRGQQRGFMLRVHPGVSQASIDAYLEQAVGARSNVRQWTGQTSKVELHLFATPLDKQLFTGSIEISSVNPVRPWAQVLLADGIPTDGGASVALALARVSLGREADAWLRDGASHAAANQYYDRSLATWIARLGAAQLWLSAAELLDPAASNKHSPHVLAPQRGLLFQTLTRQRGAEWMRGLWQGSKSLSPGDPELEAQWRKALEQAQSQRADRLEPVRRREFLASGAFAGADLVKQAGGLQSGLLNDEVDLACRQLKQLGANAVALSTYAYLDSEPPALPSLARRRSSDPDVAFLWAAAAARRSGLKLASQARILTSPSGGLAGMAPWHKPEDWIRFHEGFRTWVAHYALLAELCRADLFALGSELLHSTQWEAEPDRVYVDYQLLEDKRRLFEEEVATARGAFSGALTYVALMGPHGKEAERFQLWSSFDLLGATMFYPVTRQAWPLGSSIPRLVSDNMTENLEPLGELARDTGLPWVLWPIGFPSTIDAHSKPFELRGEVSAKRQTQLFTTLAGVLEDLKQRELSPRGLFIWNWRVHSLAGGKSERSYTPQDKPAQALLPRVFGAL